MQILLSPSKNMVATPKFRPPFTTRPRFQREAERCALQMSELSVEELARTLQTNPQLAALNKQRYHDFLDPEPRAAAVLSYTGMTYRHLRPEAFSPAEMDYAQTHLYITSFLYGLTRPLDEIKNYRMEGNVVLPDHDGQTMFRFWRSRLTDLLLEAVGADDGVLVNLASAEMKQLFDWRRVAREVRVVTPEFLVDKGDKLKNIVVYTKMMRGAVARQIIVEQPAKPEALHGFTYEGYTFRPELSKGDLWTWVLG